LYYINPENIKYSNQKYFTIEENYKKVSEGVSEQIVIQEIPNPHHPHDAGASRNKRQI